MCTRLLYRGPEDRVLTARSMDWKTDVGTNLWVFPRGLAREGAAGPRSLEWTSRYGSVIAGGYDIATTDGINEAGLVANVLWLVESSYPADDSGKPLLSLAAWAQYVLDNFATVAETVAELERGEFVVFTAAVPGEDRLATMHLSVSDASGDSAIFEYVEGRLVVHHDRAYQVMTNSPTFDEQLAISSYWEEIGGTVMLPGTNRAADRFARARFYVNAVPQVSDKREATASVFSVIRNVSVPYGISTPDQPNISSTRWRTVADHKDLTYFFDSAMSPGVFWVNVNELDLSESGSVGRLDVAGLQAAGTAGNASDAFVPAEPFAFAGVST
ncbi:linear amide C-N hydrolase [Nocardia sp. NPDC058176]|uniref:linear amide C-N hydrolase n=1 Tax=Nocardia sp. NPDC058176 TaxID=3346368 RepID=UPI0036D85B69